MSFKDPQIEAEQKRLKTAQIVFGKIVKILEGVEAVYPALIPYLLDRLVERFGKPKTN